MGVSNPGLSENLSLLFPPLDLFHSLSRAISLIYGAQRIGSDSYTVAKIVMWKCCVISTQLQLEDHATDETVHIVKLAIPATSERVRLDIFSTIHSLLVIQHGMSGV